MMVGEDDKEWRNHTFSQREGKAPLPEALQVGKLTTNFRNQVWEIIEINIAEHECLKEYEGLERIQYEEIGEETVYWGFDESKAGIFWQRFLFSYQVNVKNVRHDKIKTTTPRKLKEWVGNIIIDGEAHDVLTLLEYMLRLPNTPKKLANNIEACFEFAPYLIDRSSDPVRIISTTSEEMKECVKRALDNINQSELTGVKPHLRDAAQKLNNNDFSGSIRESIHAVESATRQIDPKTSTDFSTALNSLERSGILIHPALKKAFKNLYGYTNDEQGIRHSLVGRDVANVGFDEANFMYGACVSFVDYLASKKK